MVMCLLSENSTNHGISPLECPHHRPYLGSLAKYPMGDLDAMQMLFRKRSIPTWRDTTAGPARSANPFPHCTPLHPLSQMSHYHREKYSSSKLDVR